jgi:hypothetical protein
MKSQNKETYVRSIALFHHYVTSKQSIVLTLRIMVVGRGQNDNNTKKNTIKLHLQNRGREE